MYHSDLELRIHLDILLTKQGHVSYGLCWKYVQCIFGIGNFILVCSPNPKKLQELAKASVIQRVMKQTCATV